MQGTEQLFEATLASFSNLHATCTLPDLQLPAVARRCTCITRMSFRDLRVCKYNYVRVQIWASKLPYVTCIAPASVACCPATGSFMLEDAIAKLRSMYLHRYYTKHTQELRIDPATFQLQAEDAGGTSERGARYAFGQCA
jgi:hypothetical protein